MGSGKCCHLLQPDMYTALGWDVSNLPVLYYDITACDTWHVAGPDTITSAQLPNMLQLHDHTYHHMVCRLGIELVAASCAAV